MTNRKPSRPQRPRLEQRSTSRVRGYVAPSSKYIVVGLFDSGDIALTRTDASRLRKFLDRCERYLEARKERK